MRALAEVCRRRDVLLISDEVYRAFCYDRPFATPATWNEDVLVVDGFSKSHGMTGWRLGFAHGPSRLIQEMAKLQQFSFVCAPRMAQYGGVAALDEDLTAQIEAYHRKRDMVVASLEQTTSSSPGPEGAFYAFPRAPWGTGTEFVGRGDQEQRPHHSRQCLLSERHPLPHLVDRLVNPLGVAGRWREEVHDEQVHPLVEDVGRLLDERPDRMPTVLVPRRDNLDDGDDFPPSVSNDDPVGPLARS